MSLRLEIGSWRVWELWEVEWPALRPLMRGYRDQWGRLGMALAGRLREKDRGYVRQLLHEAMDCVTETIRLAGRAVAIFAYTIAHVLVMIAAAGALVWIGLSVG